MQMREKERGKGKGITSELHGRVASNGDARRFTRESRQSLLIRSITEPFYFILFCFWTKFWTFILLELNIGLRELQSNQ